MKDKDMKMASSGGPTAEQIAASTGASRVMREDGDSSHGRGHGLDSDLFGGGEHSALLELLRSDERLSSLFAGADRDRRDRRPRGGSSSSASNSAFAQALFGHLMQSSGPMGRRGRDVVVNEEHLRNMLDMGFPE